MCQLLFRKVLVCLQAILYFLNVAIFIIRKALKTLKSNLSTITNYVFCQSVPSPNFFFDIRNRNQDLNFIRQKVLWALPCRKRGMMCCVLFTYLPHICQQEYLEYLLKSGQNFHILCYNFQIHCSYQVSRIHSRPMLCKISAWENILRFFIFLFSFFF